MWCICSLDCFTGLLTIFPVTVEEDDISGTTENSRSQQLQVCVPFMHTIIRMPISFKLEMCVCWEHCSLAYLSQLPANGACELKTHCAKEEQTSHLCAEKWVSL